MKLEKLTTEQEALIPVIRDIWINQLYNLKDINVNQVTEGIEWLYSFCNLPKPRVIICESLLEAQLTIHVMKQMAKVAANVGANVGDNVRANVGDNVGANVWANVWANVGDITIEPICLYGDINDYGWVSFYDFFNEIGVLNNDDFNRFKNLISSNYFTMIQMDTACFVVKNPKHIRLNAQNQMNSISEYAIEFNDGTGMYFVNGQYLSDTLYQKLSQKEYTSTEFFAEKNEETKSAAIAYMQQAFGDDYVASFLRDNLTEIDTYVDKKKAEYLKGTTGGMNVGVYTLFKGEINGIAISYVRCYCPSTDRMFFLGVDPEHDNAKDAIASLYTIPAKLKPHIKGISRQGERFSTIFTPKGVELLNNITKDDLSDLVTITGDEYFNLMTYEY